MYFKFYNKFNILISILMFPIKTVSFWQSSTKLTITVYKTHAYTQTLIL